MRLPDIYDANEDFLRKLFFYFSVGLSIISLRAAFSVYLMFFGILTAILVSIIFEFLRIAIIYMFVIYKGGKNVIVGITLYACLTLACLFAAAVYYQVKIIQVTSHDYSKSEYNSEITKRIDLIKRTHAKSMDVKLDEIQKLIDINKQNIAKNIRPQYYSERLVQRMLEYTEVENKRDLFLAEMPHKELDNVEIWISRHAALNGLSFEKPLPEKTVGSNVIFKAIELLLKLKPDVFGKYIALMLAIVTELGIILLAIFSYQLSQNVDQRSRFISGKSQTPNKISQDKRESYQNEINHTQSIIQTEACDNDDFFIKVNGFESMTNYSDQSDEEVETKVILIIEKLLDKHGELLNKFVEKSSTYFNDYGKLVPTGKLYKKWQVVRKDLNEFRLNAKELSKFYEILSDGSIVTSS
jgi:hypothetical protein